MQKHSTTIFKSAGLQMACSTWMSAPRRWWSPATTRLIAGDPLSAIWAGGGHTSPLADSRPPRAAGRLPFIFEAPEFREIDQLLQVGGRQGLLASLLKQFHPHLKITVFDSHGCCESALDLFREKAQHEDLGAHPADILADPFPSGFEHIQFSMVLDALSENSVRRLLEKAYLALPCSGTILLYERISSSTNITHSRFAGARSSRQYFEWLRAAGFSDPACRPCLAGHALMTARK